MHFQDLMNELEKANPQLFKTQKMQISIAEFKNHLYRTWDIAFKEGYEAGQNSKSYFEKIFGK